MVLCMVLHVCSADKSWTAAGPGLALACARASYMRYPICLHKRKENLLCGLPQYTHCCLHLRLLSLELM